MSGPEPEALQSWASANGLAWQPEDTFPPLTQRLKLGTGLGEHRASMRTVTDKGRVITEGQKKRPERQTLGVCEGNLPGGLSGKLGHHVHLIDQGRGQEDRYIASTDTVIISQLPVRARPVFHLESAPAKPSEVKAAFTLGGKEAESPLDTVVPAPQGHASIGGLGWTSFPAESDERIRRVVSFATRSLDGLPEDRVAVEYEFGTLAVWVKGRALTDSASLDALCRFASGIAEGLLDVDGSAEPLALDQSLPLPEADARVRWVEEGANLIDWDKPPVSIVAAQERYRTEAKPKATRTGWKVYGIVGIAQFVFSLLFAVAVIGVSWAVGELPIGIIVAIVSVATGALAANRVGLKVGQGVLDSRIQSSAIPWGIEAFAQGYAEHSGLVREDHEELRRRLRVPFNGRAQIAWQGQLSPGVDGHISIWIDATANPEPPRFYLLAVSASTGASVPAGYQSQESDGQRLVWQEVTSVQRAEHRLDQLREAVGN